MCSEFKSEGVNLRLAIGWKKEFIYYLFPNIHLSVNIVFKMNYFYSSKNLKTLKNSDYFCHFTQAFCHRQCLRYICRNADGVHRQGKVGKPWTRA